MQEKEILTKLNKTYEKRTNRKIYLSFLGGFDTNKMKERLGISKSRALADFLPTITIKTKDFIAKIINFNVRNKDMKGEIKISTEHIIPFQLGNLHFELYQSSFIFWAKNGEKP